MGHTSEHTGFVQIFKFSLFNLPWYVFFKAGFTLPIVVFVPFCSLLEINHNNNGKALENMNSITKIDPAKCIKT